MPQTRVVFYQDKTGEIPVLEWLQALSKRDRKGYANCMAKICQLADSGYELRRPSADYLRDGIYELRAKHINVQYRILYFFNGKDVAILAHAIFKEGFEVPDIDIARAVSRRKMFESNTDLHTYSEEGNDDGKDE
jgi:phage-related protein